jgi:hypothetical protein
MGLKKRTYALPGETLEVFEKEVEAGKRSALIGELLRNWLEQKKRERLRREIIEGCREMADIYLEVEREYHPLEEEVHRALEAKPKTRRNRPGSARPGHRV